MIMFVNQWMDIGDVKSKKAAEKIYSRTKYYA